MRKVSNPPSSFEATTVLMSGAAKSSPTASLNVVVSAAEPESPAAALPRVREALSGR